MLSDIWSDPSRSLPKKTRKNRNFLHLDRIYVLRDFNRCSHNLTHLDDITVSAFIDNLVGELIEGIAGWMLVLCIYGARVLWNNFKNKIVTKMKKKKTKTSNKSTNRSNQIKPLVHQTKIAIIPTVAGLLVSSVSLILSAGYAI